jgi:hypothetical protein
MRQKHRVQTLIVDVDNKVMGIMDLSFSKSFWNRGDYPSYYQNGSVAEQITNPWYTSENAAAPFDQGKLSHIIGEKVQVLTGRLLPYLERCRWRNKWFLPR